MVFKCQEDSFLKEFTTKIVKCEETSEPIVEYGKVSPFIGYQITLENTIIFPAGGGQPHDLGLLNDIEVLQVLRKGEKAVHFTKEPLPVGAEVVQKINWQRRFDHVQQHSGQHLLSAMLEKEHSIPTTSWWLGAEECFVELSHPLNEDILPSVEQKCNDLIALAVPVTVKFCRANDPALDEAHTRGLQKSPKDCTDILRVVCIGDFDENMCCGTHVTNLSQLQMIKLLGVKPGKRDKVNLRFLVGNRVTKTFQQMLDREKALTALLNNEPNKHEELVSKLQKNSKSLNKRLQNVLSEMAQYEIERIKKMDPKPKYIHMFRKEATIEFNRLISKDLEDQNIFLFLVSEDCNNPGRYQIMIQTPLDTDTLLKQLVNTVNGQGVVKNGKYLGKSEDLGGINKCKTLIEEYFNNLP